MHSIFNGSHSNGIALIKKDDTLFASATQFAHIAVALAARIEATIYLAIYLAWP